MTKPLDGDKLAQNFREKALRIAQRQLLMTKFTGSLQEKDLSLGANCRGFGRIHHFRRIQDPNWIPNPLPTYPASAFLEVTPEEILLAQVYQLSVCNWRCWYCFVDFSLLSANRKYSDFVTSKELLTWMLQESPQVHIIDLSGGQPNIVPEYPLWFLHAREELGISSTHFVWLDDNLSTNYVWTFLTDEEREYMVKIPGFSRVGCIKGYDEESFAFNTAAEGSLLFRQIDILARLVQTGFDQYAYITLTGPDRDGLESKIPKLLDLIATNVHENFPLRIVPLRVFPFQANQSRFSTEAEKIQFYALEVWQKEMQRRFTSVQLATPIQEVTLF